MNRTLKISLFILGIFVCGVVVGAVGARRLAERSSRAHGGGGPETFGPHLMRRLTSELALTQDQLAAIDPVIKQAGEQLRELRRDSMKQSGAIIEAMDAAISAELAPAQREKFVVLKEAQKARMKAIMEERHRRRSAEGGDERGRERDGERERKRRDEGPPPS